MKEQKFPIYRFSFQWTEDGDHDPKWTRSWEGLPEGRVRNSTGFSRMFREEQTDEQLDAFLKDYWEKLTTKDRSPRHPIVNPELVSMDAKYVEHETWVLTWFQHETFDIGQTDEEALQSFSEYVSRTEAKNNELEYTYGDEKYKHGYKCLMGAEESWRWRGAEPNGGPEDHSPAPCRCKFCKEQGVLRIGH